MAFASKKIKETIMGDMRVHMGSFTQGNGDTGGAIDTGLSEVNHFHAIAALNVAKNGGTVTITTADPTEAQAGDWLAMGY
ncbi:hypothetical protein [Oceanidesulfovibrio marinus]|uniref:Uncharacterized protein n=1 Tax=Oceanidesulfovibrio marinus TaxID=370038 RepID=A0A6P1ZB65_9BACT|nr:hypothetical protein [Oceanidesulfovibrio marinus]TVM31163.1 hypothetical protein DQK91_18815 [Oceanidesulfovibrio marinus]